MIDGFKDEIVSRLKGLAVTAIGAALIFGAWVLYLKNPNIEFEFGVDCTKLDGDIRKERFAFRGGNLRLVYRIHDQYAGSNKGYERLEGDAHYSTTPTTYEFGGWTLNRQTLEMTHRLPGGLTHHNYICDLLDPAEIEELIELAKRPAGTEGNRI